MFTVRNPAIHRQTPAPFAIRPESIRQVFSAPARPAINVQAPAISYASAATRTAIPRAFDSPKNEMGFSLGGIVKAGARLAGRSIPGVSQVMDAISLVGTLSRSQSTAGRVFSTPIARLPAPAVIAPPRAAAGAPQLPQLKLPGMTTGGLVKTGGNVPATGKGSPDVFQTPDGVWHRKTWRDGGRRRRRMNPMNVKAVRRAARRIEGAEKLFRKILRISGAKSSGTVTFKRKRKRA